MQKVLITGISGFVGQHLANALTGEYEVVGLSHTPSNKYIHCDILDKNRLTEIINHEKPDFLIHLAAITKSWFAHSEEIFKINLFGTLNLYESIILARQNSSYNPKILYVSTAQVYGNSSSSQGVDENYPICPTRFYAASKAAADRASYTYSQLGKLNIVILRPFTHTGPGQKTGFFLPDVASQIARLEKSPKENILYVGNLSSVRDYLDVRDVVEAYKLIMKAPWKPGETFNIASGKGIRTKKILEILVNLSTKKLIVKLDKKRLRPVDEAIIIGNSLKIRKLTGWKPKIKIDQTIKETLEYWRNNT